MIEKGKTLSKPADPSKSGCIFGGWYTDPNFQTEAQFPITVNSDITIYAQFYDYQEAFREARNNTIGNNVPGFEYDYTLNVDVKYNALDLPGRTSGSAQYSQTGEVGFYDSHSNSGVLFYDGSKYQIRRGTTLQKISLDKYDSLNSYSVEEVDANFKYDTSSFAKAVFEYDDEQLKSIAPTNKKDEYKLKTSMNVSTAIAILGNNINNPLVVKVIGELPETSVDTGMYVTFSGGKIASYRYEMNIDVSTIQLSLVYTLTFTSSGTAMTIVPRTFTGIALTPQEVSNETNAAAAVVNAFKGKTQSGYDFVVKTGVDFGVANAEINSTFKGSAYRKVDAASVYFHNDIEIDSDYKNANMYKDAGIEDIHVKETRLANGEVHLIEKKLLTDKTQQVTNFVPSDKTSYFLFDVLSHTGTYTFAEKTTKDGITSYSFGLSIAGLAELLSWMNDSLNLDPFSRASAKALVYGSFVESSVLVNTGKLVINVKSGVLDSIQIVVEGDVTTSFAGSRDFTTASKAQIKLDYTLTPNAAGDSFVPYETVKAAK